MKILRSLSVLSYAVAVVVALLMTSCDATSGTMSGGASETASTSPAPLPTPDELQNRIDAVLDYTRYQRELRLDRHAAWQILHGVLAYGPDFEVTHGDGRVKVVNHVLSGGAMEGWNMRRSPHGVEAILEPGTKTGQGHPDQWLAILAQCGFPSTHPIKVAGSEFQLGDMLKHASNDLYEGKECSWTLIALCEYVHPESTWRARDGSNWNLERIVGMEAAADVEEAAAREHINSAACGGSHRLIGLTMALNKYRKRLPETSLGGHWQTAQQRIDWAVEMARKNQLANGAFSVHYFDRSSNSPDLAEHLGATGHTLEFLALALDKEQLAEPWVVRGANYLCEVFERTESVDLECGALYHAAHGLVLYRQKRFGPRDSAETSNAPSSDVTARTAQSNSPK